MLDGRRRVDGQARMAAELAHPAQHAVDMRRGLGVDRDHVGASGGERIDVPLGPLHHEVHVEQRAGGVDLLADGVDDQSTDRDGRDEAPVHDVDVDHAGARAEDRGELVAEPGEVGGEDRWSDLVARERALRRGRHGPTTSAVRSTRGPSPPSATVARPVTRW